MVFDPTLTPAGPNIVSEVTDELRVEYPCDPSLRSVGRVAVVGVLLRLRMPMATVELFRNELDTAIGLAAGSNPEPRSVLTVWARWDAEELAVDITGPASRQHLSHPRVYR
jgi:hypothetical protein